MVTPFLPGDSLLFAAGALAAVDTSGTLSAPLLSLLLIVAAITGNTTNYHIGRWIGPPAFSGTHPLPQGGVPAAHRGVLPEVRLDDHRDVALRADPAHLRAVRRRRRAHAVRALPGLQRRSAASPGCCRSSGLGYFFGNIPFIKENFGLVTIGIIVVSLIPVAWRGASKVGNVSSAYRSFAHRVDIGAPVRARVARLHRQPRAGALERRAAPASRRAKRAALHVMFGGGVELDAHIDVLVTAQRMRLILLPTRGMPTSRCGHRRGLPVRAAIADQHRGAVAEQRSAFRAGLGDVLSRRSAATGSWR